MAKAAAHIAAPAPEDEAGQPKPEIGSMGLSGIFKTYGQVTAMVLIAVGMSMAFLWLRDDSISDRESYRQQVIRQEQLAEERRRETRQDAQRAEDLFRATLDAISRDNREANASLSRGADQMRNASTAMEGASKSMSGVAESISRIEKVLTNKMPSPE